MSAPDFSFSGHTSTRDEILDVELSMIGDGVKEQICREVLAEAGVNHVSVNKKGEMIHRCVMPWHDDGKPSASLNYKKLLYNCLGPETLVKTFEGDRPIADLAGTTQVLLDGGGKWVEAEVKAFGRQKLMRVTLSRNGVQKIIYATPNHRWLVRPKGRDSALVETTTSALVPRQRIPSVWTHQRAGRLVVSPFGVARGFVYGDGTSTRHSAVANFIGEKDRALIPFFEKCQITTTDLGHRINTGIPRSWKMERPELDEGSSYLYGWLAGYFAADGHVSATGVTILNSARREDLEYVQALCDRIGVATYGIGEQEREGINGERSMLYKLTFRSSSLTEGFFLIDQHRERWVEGQARRKYERTHWWVTSVEETDRFEEVYCAVVPTTHSFVLADNILTGNCYSCGSAGGLLWLIGIIRGTDSGMAAGWLRDRAGLVGPQDITDVLSFLDSLMTTETGLGLRPIPRMSPKLLDQWDYIHPYVTEVRSIPLDNVRALRIGWNPIENRIVIPHLWGEDLVGWQTRRMIDDGTPKFRASPDFPAETTIYNYDREQHTAVVVEAPLSCARHYHHAHMEATFGAEVTDAQVRLLSHHQRIILWMDNDDAGWRTTEDLIERIGRYTQVWCTESPYAADPADLDDDVVDRILAEATPASLWSPPTHLEVVA